MKEASVATVLVIVLVVALAWTLSSPDVPPVTIQTWAKIAPSDFLGTAANELAGTTETANYGPPYNNGTSNVQTILFSPQKLAGVIDPIDAAQSFVLGPLTAVSGSNPALSGVLSTYKGSSSDQQTKWVTAYVGALAKVKFVAGAPVVPTTAAGPVPTLMATELSVAQSGGLDADLLAQQPFYGTDFTRPLLFLEDGQYFGSLARADNLTGSQWGVMNETGSYPGQPWLWLYTIWYQIPGFSTSANVDLIAVYLTGLATLLLLFVPFLPGLRDIPRLVPVHRLVWRNSGAVGPEPPGGLPQADPPPRSTPMPQAPFPADVSPPEGPPPTASEVT